MNESNACVKHILVCFHGGTLWLDTPIMVMVELILEIMGFPKDGPEPLQYLKGRDNNKHIAT